MGLKSKKNNVIVEIIFLLLTSQMLYYFTFSSMQKVMSEISSPFSSNSWKFDDKVSMADIEEDNLSPTQHDIIQVITY
jgi:hypothetical protein